MTSLKSPTALLIGAGESQRPLANALRGRGFRLVAMARDHPSFIVDQFVKVSTYDVQGALDAAVSLNAEVPLSIVASRTSGPAALTLGTIAQRLGLPGPGLDLSGAAEQKMALFQWCGQLGVPAIDTCIAGHGDQVSANSCYPVVVKPNIGTVGKRGVTFVPSARSIGQAIDAARLASWDGTAVIQPFIDGYDYNLHVAAVDGCIVWRIVTQEINTFSRQGYIEFAAQAHVDLTTQQKVLSLTLSRASALTQAARLTGHAVFSFKIVPRNRRHQTLTLCYETNIGPPGDGVTELMSAFYGHDAFGFEVDALLRATRFRAN